MTDKVKKQKIRFNVPVKILVVEGRHSYCRTVWTAIGVGVAHLMIGGATMASLLYTLRTGDLHAILCSFAYQCLSAEAILCLNYVNGWSAPLRLLHRRCVHVFLQSCALICGITGTILVINDKGITAKGHGITGIITTIFAFLSLLSGIFAIYFRKYAKIVHVSMGLPAAFTMSSLCFVLGIYTPAYRDWADISVVYILLGFITFYSIFVFTTAFLKCMMRL